MTRETFFEKFDILAEAPDSLTRMRELVLELAVRGALSDRLPADSDEDSWRNFVAGLDSPEADVPLPFSIPKVWRWVCLDDLGRTRIQNEAEPETRVSFVPMALIPAEYGLAAQFEERAWSEVRKGFTHFADGDVVMAKITPCFENGKSAVMRNLIHGIGAGTTELHVFRPDKPVILPEFVLIYLKTKGFISRGEPSMTGSAGQKRVPHGYFARSPFPLPPPAEQTRIVAKVNELVALCDRLQAQQKEREARSVGLARASMDRFVEAPSPTNFNLLFHKAYDISPVDLRKAILSLALQGKLVSRDPDDEPADRSLPKLARVAVDSEDDLYPPHWLRVPLGKTGEWRGGGTPSKSRPDYWEGTVPWVSPKDMKRLRIGDAQDHISESAVEGSAVRKIPDGSILMVVRGMILAKAFPVAITTREVTINQDMKALLPFEPETAEFLLMALRALEPQVLAAIERSTHGTCKLQTGVLEAFTIPFPPLAEQRRIVAKADFLISRIDGLEGQIAKARSLGRDLLEAVVAELSV